MWAKTGTAEATPLPADDDCDGQVDRMITGLDHAWFVGMVGPQGAARPEYVITVVIEHGGSGGRTAGPVANQIIHALQVEGYLPHAEDET